MSDFELLSLVIAIISIIVKLLLEIIKGNKNNYLMRFGWPWDSYFNVINPEHNRLSAVPLSLTL